MSPSPISIVVMGVAGSGKTTIGRALAERLGIAFHDGDDYHPQSNVTKMARGEPLDDEDRGEWLATLRKLMIREEERGAAIVVACSALKHRYRELLAHGESPIFVYLAITPELAQKRLLSRQDHFMPATLVPSQFAALEAPSEAICVDGAAPLAELVDTVTHRVRNALAGGRGA